MDEKDVFSVLSHGVSVALDRFYEYDADLLDRGVSEMCLVGNFYRYFHSAVWEALGDSSLRIDLEYDRQGNDRDLKRVSLRRRTVVRPDLVVHRRGGPSGNLCAIEFKRGDRVRGLAWVDRKLRAYTSRDGHGYRFGCYVEFGARRADCKVVWYRLHAGGQRARMDGTPS